MNFLLFPPRSAFAPEYDFKISFSCSATAFLSVTPFLIRELSLSKLEVLTVGRHCLPCVQKPESAPVTVTLHGGRLSPWHVGSERTYSHRLLHFC